MSNEPAEQFNKLCDPGCSVPTSVALRFGLQDDEHCTGKQEDKQKCKQQSWQTRQVVATCDWRSINPGPSSGLYPLYFHTLTHEVAHPHPPPPIAKVLRHCQSSPRRRQCPRRQCSQRASSSTGRQTRLRASWLESIKRPPRGRQHPHAVSCNTPIYPAVRAHLQSHVRLTWSQVRPHRLTTICLSLADSAPHSLIPRCHAPSTQRPCCSPRRASHPSAPLGSPQAEPCDPSQARAGTHSCHNRGS